MNTVGRLTHQYLCIIDAFNILLKIYTWWTVFTDFLTWWQLIFFRKQRSARNLRLLQQRMILSKPPVVLWNLSRQCADQPKSVNLLPGIELLAGTLPGFFWTTFARCVRLFPWRRAWNLIPSCTFKSVRSLKVEFAT